MVSLSHQGAHLTFIWLKRTEAPRKTNHENAKHAPHAFMQLFIYWFFRNFILL
jgi:hypothetical protein